MYIPDNSIANYALESDHCTKAGDIKVTTGKNVIHESCAQANDLWLYARVSASHSIQECPQQWRHALDVAREIARSLRTVTFEPDATGMNSSAVAATRDQPCDRGDADVPDEQTTASKTHNVSKDTALDAVDSHSLDLSKASYVYSSVPQPLWLNCHSPHLHRFCRNVLWESGEKFAETAAAHGRIKVMHMRGVTYR